MSQPFRYDWLAAKQRIIESGEQPDSFCLYCLPKAGVLLLNALLERADWEATYRVPDFDYSLYQDEIQDIVDSTEVGLMTDCNDVISLIVSEVTNNITTIITENNTTIASYADVCCYLESGQPIVDPPASTTDPDGEWKENQCTQAQLAHDNGSNFLSQVFNFGTTGGAITTGVIAALLASAAITVGLAFIVALIIVLTKAILDLATDEIEQNWIDIKKDVVCAIYNATTATEAKAAVHAVIDAANINGTGKSIFKHLYSQGQINKIWDLQIGDDAGYSSTYCETCGTEEYDFNILWTFDNDREEWSSAGEMDYFPTEQNLGGQVGSETKWSAITQAAITTRLGIPAGSVLELSFFQATFYCDGVTSFPATARLQVWQGDWTTEQASLQINANGIPETLTFDLSEAPLLLSEGPNGLFRVLGDQLNPVGGDQFLHVDNIIARGNIIAI